MPTDTRSDICVFTFGWVQAKVENRMWNYLNFCFFACSTTLFLSEILAECFPPSVPMDGMYVVQRGKHTGLKDTYYLCAKGFLLNGSRRRSCTVNNTWTGEVPFCDFPSEIRSISVKAFFAGNRTNFGDNETSKLIDKDLNTCSLYPMSSGSKLKVRLKNIAVINTIRLYIEEGGGTLKVFSVNENRASDCRTIHTERLEFSKQSELTARRQVHKRWKTISCVSEVVGDEIVISFHGPNINLCEVQVYTYDVTSCVLPPGDLNFPTHQLLVNRKRAQLKCEDPNPEDLPYFECKNRTWERGGQTSCKGQTASKNSTRQTASKNSTMIIAIVVSLVLLLGCVSVAAVLIIRQRHPVDVQPGNEDCWVEEGYDNPTLQDESKFSNMNFAELSEYEEIHYNA